MARADALAVSPATGLTMTAGESQCYGAAKTICTLAGVTNECVGGACASLGCYTACSGWWIFSSWCGHGACAAAAAGG